MLKDHKGLPSHFWRLHGDHIQYTAELRAQDVQLAAPCMPQRCPSVCARDGQRMGAGARGVASWRMLVQCLASARAARSVNEPSQQLLAQLVVDVVDVDGLVWQRNLPSRCIGRRAYPPREAAHAACHAVLPPTLARSLNRSAIFWTSESLTQRQSCEQVTSKDPNPQSTAC